MLQVVSKKMYDQNVSLYIEKCPQWTENELYIYDRFKFWTEIVGGISYRHFVTSNAGSAR